MFPPAMSGKWKTCFSELNLASTRPTMNYVENSAEVLFAAVSRGRTRKKREREREREPTDSIRVASP